MCMIMRQSDPTRDAFIQGLSHIAQEEGMSRICGRVFALLLYDGGPIAFGALAEQLDVSRGSISAAVRYLEGRGMARRLTIDGHRGVFFELTDNPYAGFMEALLDRSQMASSFIQAAVATAGVDAPDRQDRLRDLERFYQELQGMTATLIARLSGETK